MGVGIMFEVDIVLIQQIAHPECHGSWGKGIALAVLVIHMWDVLLRNGLCTLYDESSLRALPSALDFVREYGA